MASPIPATTVEDETATPSEPPPPPTPSVSASPMPTGNEEFPIPCRRFIATLRGTPDEIWSKHLQIQHGIENHTMTEWRNLLDGHRDRPAYRDL